uniref:Cytochrome b5 heme-binding domain-containing protein n=1 Tax=Romanomermis culicivorax TaxID=13658 RepID=A0A915L5C8_ROMCU
MTADDFNNTFTMDEVKQHKNPNSVWIVIRDSVYDVTKFLEEPLVATEIKKQFCGIPWEDITNSQLFIGQAERRISQKSCLNTFGSDFQSENDSVK